MKKVSLFLVISFFYFNTAFAENIKINKLSNINSWEPMEMIIGDYRIYTHRAGGLKIRRISDNKQLVVFSDKFKIKFYNNGSDLFDFVLNEKKNDISINFNDIKIFTWKGKYISKHNAYFFQLLSYTNEPFHYYIKFNNGKSPIALNMKKFDHKIAKAVGKVKIKLAAKYNITPELIDLILKKQKIEVDKKLDAVIGEERKNLEQKLDDKIQQTVDETLQASVNDEIAKEIEITIGEELAKEFDSIIIDGMEAEFTSIINEAVEEAVNEGISQATAEAAVRAVMDVLAKGGSEEEAMNACRAIAGDAC